MPAAKLDALIANDPEMKNAKHKPGGAVVKNQDIFKPSTFSSSQRLLRITAYCMRSLSNAKKKARNQVSSNEVCEGPLVTDEMDQAERYWIRSAQKDLEDWQNRVSNLAPFVKEGVVRVGGRLRHAPLPMKRSIPYLASKPSRIQADYVRSTYSNCSWRT